MDVGLWREDLRMYARCHRSLLSCKLSFVLRGVLDNTQDKAAV